MPPGSWKHERMKNSVSLIRSSNTIRAKVSEYISFECYTQSDTMLAMSQSIGHDNCTGYEPEKNIVYFEPTDKVRCILGSDGLFDMMLLEDAILPEPPLTPEEFHDILQDQKEFMILSAEQLVRKAEMRWKQKWNYRWCITDYTKVMETYFGGYDDISAIVWKYN
jgi:serine/threonine protein phosphatase PrpC